MVRTVTIQEKGLEIFHILCNVVNLITYGVV